MIEQKYLCRATSVTGADSIVLGERSSDLAPDNHIVELPASIPDPTTLLASRLSDVVMPSETSSFILGSVRLQINRLPLTSMKAVPITSGLGLHDIRHEATFKDCLKSSIFKSPTLAALIMRP